MAEHTEGPWRIAHGTANTLVLTPKRDITIATISGGFSSDTTLANARLIAAAPELLEALIYADLQLRGYGQIDPKVRAAIAKARSRSRLRR